MDMKTYETLPAAYSRLGRETRQVHGAIHETARVRWLDCEERRAALTALADPLFPDGTQAASLRGNLKAEGAAEALQFIESSPGCAS